MGEIVMGEVDMGQAESAGEGGCHVQGWSCVRLMSRNNDTLLPTGAILKVLVVKFDLTILVILTIV